MDMNEIIISTPGELIGVDVLETDLKIISLF